MTKQILRKELGRKVEGEIEIIENEYIKKEILTDDEIDDICCYFIHAVSDVGVYYKKGKIEHININKLLDTIDNYMFEILLGVDEKLEKWKGYDLWMCD